MIEELLFKTGIPTFKTTLSTDLVAVGDVNLGQDAPTNIGWIYGMAVNVGGNSYDNSKPLITLVEAGALWLTLKIGSSDFVKNLRLSNLEFQEASVTRGQERNYMPCSIPLALDWKQSTISNATGITGKTVLLDMWYIDKPSYDKLLQSKVIWKTGINPNG